MKQISGIKAVFIDLDGTLLESVDTVTPHTVEVLKRVIKKRILPIISTGRPAYESEFAAHITGANTYLISSSGARIYKDYRERKLLYEVYMPKEVYQRIISWLLKEKVFFEVYIGDRGYSQKDIFPMIDNCGMVPDAVNFFRRKIAPVDDLVRYIEDSRGHVNKIFASVSDNDSFMALSKKLNLFPGVYTDTSGWHYIEIVPENVSKKRAVRDVSRSLHLKKEEIMAIGDSHNDLGMFEESFISVAMENSPPEVKEKADLIAPSNKNDGVAKILEKLLLSTEGKGYV